MADKKDTLGGLNDAVETLNKDNRTDNIQSGQVLGNIDATMKDIYSINSQMLEVMSAIQQSLAPDAFGAAQETEEKREQGAPIVGGPAEQSAVVTPAEGKKGMGMLGMLGVAAAGAVAGLVAAFAGFLDFDAQAVKDKVIILTSIADEVDAAETAETVATLAALGAGLAIFGIGSAIAGLSSALTNFTDPTWAQSIKDNVVILSSIAEIPFGDVAETTASLGLLGVGLAIFGIGSAVAGLSSALTNFLDPDWGPTIVENVKTLVSIADLPFGDVAEATAALGLIGAGLAVFGVGSAIAGMGEAVAKFAGGTDWTQTIKDNVINLASVTDEVTPDKAASFSEAMGSMAAGLMKFAGGNFISSILDAGAALMNFLSGSESPIEQMMRVADNEEKLAKGADALDRIRIALGGLSALNFDGSDLGLQEFAEDLVQSIPAIEKAIMGGRIEGGWFGDDVEFKGLASPDINFEDAIRNITRLREALGAQAAPSAPAVQSTQPVAQTAVPTSTGAGVSGQPSPEVEVVDAGDLSLPYNTREKLARARQLARAMGVSRTANRVSYEGNIPISVNGVDIPHQLYTDEEIEAINNRRQGRLDLGVSSRQLLPSRQTGQSLQTAQAEANANAGANTGGNAVVQQNIAPNTINNASTTNIATRTQHHKPDDMELLAGAY